MRAFSDCSPLIFFFVTTNLPSTQHMMCTKSSAERQIHDVQRFFPKVLKGWGGFSRCYGAWFPLDFLFLTWVDPWELLIFLTGSFRDSLLLLFSQKWIFAEKRINLWCFKKYEIEFCIFRISFATKRSQIQILSEPPIFLTGFFLWLVAAIELICLKWISVENV